LYGCEMPDGVEFDYRTEQLVLSGSMTGQIHLISDGWRQVTGSHVSDIYNKSDLAT
jgi:hypothetical protein